MRQRQESPQEHEQRQRELHTSDGNPRADEETVLRRKGKFHRRGNRHLRALESYVRRLGRLEEIAAEFAGVERAYALQAGREIRVIVDPSTHDDLGAADLARRIARKLENDLQYPGQIEVNVIREFRAKDYAR